MNKEIIEQLDSLQIGDLVWWKDNNKAMVIGIVMQLSDNGDYFWKAVFPQDGEHCYWGEGLYEYAEDGRLGVVCKSET